MNKTPLFIIYDAAAGSGKTFTLVKEYLKIILTSKNDGYYKYILAIIGAQVCQQLVELAIINDKTDTETLF